MPESFVRRNLTTILVAMTTAAVTGGGTAVAATVVDFARNADKVDNIHAGPANTTSRANKLIATDAAGKLPASILPPVNADRVDGLHAASAASTAKAGKLVATDSKGQFPVSVVPKDATPFSKYIVVRSDAGTPALNAARLQAKVNALTGSATNRYVVLVEPGAYDFGAGKLTMKPFVDVVGAGVGRTILTGTGGSAAESATVHLAKDAALRQVSVKTLAQAGTTPVSYVGGLVYTDAGGAALAEDVEVDASYTSPLPKGTGTAYGVRHTGYELTLRRVRISANNGGSTNHAVFNKGFLVAEETTGYANGMANANYGIQTDGIASEFMTYSSVRLTDSEFAAYNGGVNWGLKSYNGFGTIVRSVLRGSIALEAHSADKVEERFQIEGSTLAGSDSTIILYPGNEARIWRGSQLDGGPVNKYYGATGAVHCTGVYNGQYTFYASGCP